MIAAGPTRYRIGTASWTDPTLLQSGFYPAPAACEAPPLSRAWDRGRG